ncbi:conserved membrane protein of unknown function [Thauera humireducens]|jgi:putative tricarboxylic transport membrane protein|uniref:DUF1468 domain-containing protein n=2 Tax=Thauera humireducens TaxID=1134435 RepID=A0A127K9B4_9RHOO|nr:MULTISPECIES: tripartite tricarboxylate transporter TctB family protein [Thauera]AMO38481.1 hypothetical protein AC731_016955 [Thauera humireducens]ENO77521.1 hypothetical protein C664_11645 [Thauera sp. 63]CAH1746016.1 conserved membrane protein of unknown function [Thauera humireducens]
MHIQRRRLAGEVVFALLLLAASLFLFWHSYKISGFSSFTSAGAYPMVTTAVMSISAIIILFQTLRVGRVEGEPGQSLIFQFYAHVTPTLIVAFTAAIIGYMLALEQLGFILSSYVFLVISMWLLGSRKLMINLLVSAAMIGFIYVVFQTIFSVVVPKGTLIQGLFK